MKRQLQHNASSSDEPSYTNVLADWITTMATFHCHYDQIARLITACKLQQPFVKSGTGLGQCSAEELTNLMARMEHELGRLLLDMKPCVHMTIPENYQKLNAHTQVLDALNQEAKKLIVLTILSAS